MIPTATRRGYVFLITILFLGAIALAASVSLLLLAWAAEQNGQTYAQATQALEMARGCIDYGIKQLRSNLNYAGGDTLAFPSGSCVVLSVQGNGPSNRTLCSEGTSGSTTKRLKVSIKELFPAPVIDAFEESLTTSACTSPVTFTPPPPASSVPPPASSSIAASSSMASSVISSSSSPSPPPSSSSAIASSSSSTPISSSSSAASSSSSAGSSSAGSIASSSSSSSVASSASSSSTFCLPKNSYCEYNGICCSNDCNISSHRCK